jgi:TetR/AcrR family transcriptional regulator, cholesterol catabolism regulator
MRPIPNDSVATPLAPKARPRPEGPTRYEEILAGAADLFYTKGYAATTLNDIANAAGLNKASLYHYINSKEDILFSIVEIVHNRMGDWRDRTDPGGEPDLQVATIIASHLVGTATHAREVRMFYNEYRHLSRTRFEPVIRERDAYEHAVRQLIRRGQNQGMFSATLDPDMAGVTFLAMLNSVSTWFDPKGRWTAYDLWKNYSELILRGLGVPKRRLAKLVADVEALGYFAHP